MPDIPRLGHSLGLEAAHPSSDCQKFPFLLYINQSPSDPSVSPQSPTSVPQPPSLESLSEMVMSSTSPHPPPGPHRGLIPFATWVVSPVGLSLYPQSQELGI